jgi:hypothetical protein
MGVQANDQNQPVENEVDEKEQQINSSTQRPAGQSEGAASEPSAADIKELYEATGVKAPVPTGKSAGRPKTSDVRAKKSEQNGAGNSNSGQEGNDDDKGKSKAASNSGSDDDSGNSANSKGSKDGSDDGKVQGKPGEADKGVRDAESRAKEDSERGSEENPDDGASGDESAEHDSDGKKEGEPTDEEGVKRPGKSNPAVEQRFQKLTTDLKERDAEIERLNAELQKTAQEKAQTKVAQADPEYKVEDFKMVRDNKTGEIKELTDEQAELAWHRWKQGYDQRAEERQAETNRQAGLMQREQEITTRIMTESVQAYDTIASLMQDYPELVQSSGQFDEDFAAEAMPLIEEAIEYMPGTEPGNETGALPIIVGLRVDPRRTLNALKKVNNKKRGLPLNGVNDNVESRSNVAVPHSRSSDPTVQAANELMKELKIDKRF